METEYDQRKGPGAGIWILVIVCMGLVIFTLACGAAYTGISSARMTAAKASAGHIESVFFLAEKTAEENGLRPENETADNLLTSYGDSSDSELSDYEQFVLDSMLDTFGPQRDFDFAIKRFEDGSGVHTQIYYFPVKGLTNLNQDRYYLVTDGILTENNSL
ncbi:hypothetical protein LJC49_09185 [Ruminococcaceae bacterium OttesenSCG-928-I18]|nr:hypothetical protein [Ruminococcaceae bacterium OttesenSCG-928-I18]